MVRDAALHRPARAEALRESVIRRVESVPLLYKVLIANVAIVVVGAIAGTFVTAATFRDVAAPTRYELALIFALIGMLVSAIVNYAVLRAAFQPLDSLERLAERVRGGDLSSRARPTPASDPQLARLVETFNDTLDELEHDQVQLRQLATQVIQAQEGERKRISRELHDDTAQVLFAQLLRVTSLKASAHEEVRATAEHLETLTVEAIESVRRLALELRPPALDDLGLREALDDLVQRFSNTTPVRVRLDVDGLRSRLAPEIELVLYRVAQEALTNVIKHAGASSARVAVSRNAGSVRLTVDDDGMGFDPAGATARNDEGLGLGLFGMEERVALVGGTLAIRKLAPHGTRVAATIPLGTSGWRATHEAAGQVGAT